jgi:hypothetical protein
LSTFLFRFFSNRVEQKGLKIQGGRVQATKTDPLNPRIPFIRQEGVEITSFFDDNFLFLNDKCVSVKDAVPKTALTRAFHVG